MKQVLEMVLATTHNLDGHHHKVLGDWSGGSTHVFRSHGVCVGFEWEPLSPHSDQQFKKAPIRCDTRACQGCTLWKDCLNTYGKLVEPAHHRSVTSPLCGAAFAMLPLCPPCREPLISRRCRVAQRGRTLHSPRIRADHLQPSQLKRSLRYYSRVVTNIVQLPVIAPLLQDTVAHLRILSFSKN